MSYDPTLFEGAAAHYRNGRPPYSPQLEPVLTGELGLGGNGRLFDGGCGPGVLTVRLAHLFEEAVGLDRDGDSESVVSGYFSLSSAPHLFGERADEFACEIRELLASRSPDGVFWDWPRRHRGRPAGQKLKPAGYA